MAVEEERRPSLERFTGAAARDVFELPAGNLSFDSWEAALRAVLAALPRTARRTGTPPVLVIDELPHLLPHSPELWLSRSVLDPSHALFDETGYLLREDPRITDRALHQSVLAAVSRGATTPSGPHFEHLARVWCAGRAAAQFFGEQFGPVGPTVVKRRDRPRQAW